MPTISLFFGIIVKMYYLDNKTHHLPHIHVEYQDFEAVISIPEGSVLAGKLPENKLKLIQAWIIIHADDLMANWKLAITGNATYRIEGLK